MSPTDKSAGQAGHEGGGWRGHRGQNPLAGGSGRLYWRVPQEEVQARPQPLPPPGQESRVTRRSSRLRAGPGAVAGVLARGEIPAGPGRTLRAHKVRDPMPRIARHPRTDPHLGLCPPASTSSPRDCDSKYPRLGARGPWGPAALGEQQARRPPTWAPAQTTTCPHSNRWRRAAPPGSTGTHECRDRLRDLGAGHRSRNPVPGWWMLLELPEGGLL